ncbi:undecaprenyldiphospho-muramoylpentapeptide beta-N-acetylglucosaminyltransferase [Selenomonadales bacterium OttesenSCG-928-I06]|nr:undecaprenyldiphospho-muramoylpentapeptide beta-N-acetylglucosaminyltransferase [Selenomonadales bacterium OttesenSCG-928-I06]
MKFIISGGGTGGHIYPALAIAKELTLLDDKCEILFVGTKEGLESDIVPKEGYKFTTINVQGFERSLSFSNVTTILKAGTSVFSSIQIIKKFKPDVVIGTGGFVCGPVLLAASLLNKKTIIQEQNAIPGVSNKILAKFVDKIALGYKEAETYFSKYKGKIIVTGNPIRKDVLEEDRTESLKSLSLLNNKKTLLISGGSRGARSINNAMIDIYKILSKDNSLKDTLQILHVTGKTEYNSVVEKLTNSGIEVSKIGNITIQPYLYNMPQALAVADLAIFRAGAIGLAELTAKGIPSILIPYPYATANHQEINARVLEKKGAAIVIKDSELNGEELLAVIYSLINNENKLHDMAEKSKEAGFKDAASTIAKLAFSLVKK